MDLETTQVKHPGIFFFKICVSKARENALSLCLIGRLGHVSKLVYLLIPSFTKYLLKASHMLGTKLDAQNKKIKRSKILALRALRHYKDKLV